MSIDILIFAAVAAVLIYRLRSVLGEKHGEERERPNEFSEKKKENLSEQTAEIIPINEEAVGAQVHLSAQDLVDVKNGKPNETVLSGLTDITIADTSFDTVSFVEGAKGAFEMIVMSYSMGDKEKLKSLLSPNLYESFEQGIKDREKKGHTVEMEIHRIKKATILEASLGGTMAYIKIDFSVEETSVTKDKKGKVIEGDPDKITEIEDIWTFARDIRSQDPNWMLIETGTKKKK